MTGPGGLALLVNPTTTTGPRDIARVDELAQRLRAIDVAMTRRDDPGGVSLIDAWYRRGVRSIAVVGGDGTLGNVLTGLHRAGRTHQFDIVLLDGGSLGLVATMLGARDAWKRVLGSGDREGAIRFAPAPLPTLMTSAGLGFVVGAGAVASVSRDFQRPRRTRGQVLSYAVGRIAGALCGGASVSLLDGYQGGLAYDGNRSPGERWLGVLVTSLWQVGRGPEPVLRFDGLRTLALRVEAGVAARPRLVDIVAGRWTAETRDAREVRLEASRPFDVLVDGEIHEVGHSLTVQRGPTFRAWFPRMPAVTLPGHETSRGDFMARATPVP